MPYMNDQTQDNRSTPTEAGSRPSNYGSSYNPSQPNSIPPRSVRRISRKGI
ncbi:hypothetical protein L202_00894 [Cryptococcus amylolentus CBS 6039]|uniref:Uncharacterized protein n=1 Tax=Cryptococcus amylolentus CBS 6039 TaxID=1295533 RepID=A0A1E3IAY3_9TREE|nr:hypothetical protein L202_00894 [Cryptococcus amylolentus CBS 6039]ODN85066.1 hypothetical protein L202_00894 [Cryptococcus amylolentus CBS 6039]